MKAVLFDTYGDESVLQYREAATPEPGPGEVRIKVSRVGVNRLDLMARAGQVGQLSLPHISGSEVAGIIDALGPGVDRPLGQRVAVAPYLFCGRCESCLRGDETTCLRSDILGLHSQGGYAEFVVVPETNLVPIPDNVTDSQAAAVTLSTITAWHMLVDRARVRPGDLVLVWAAGSGVGSAAVQIAQLQGAEVIACAGSDDKVRRAQDAYGARWGINYQREDVAERVRAITHKRGVDVVFEHLGQDTIQTSMKCLARGGRTVTCGTLTGPRAAIDLWSLFAKELSLIGAYGGTRENLRDVLEAVSRERLKAVIDREYPLKDAAQAQSRMAERAQYGKILLVP
ncbi:zinc-binding dehydrogenase [Sulfobacillus harzensis]|uniref:Zinc-binding dehydrogenase n=1 Tax=Sulfobacillus harzensis TaxID=2729629 RepID=A0A7Y0L6E0_9FIRM|nr:zinc-binding dehydrogenase [Sulfobacillus harzensis]NMP24081.1 zinc-binding dehydrogenase [Sulfobacillus harzensis]